MNYTQTKDSVIFELPLSDYLGKRYYYKYDPITHKRGERLEKRIESLQEYEEYMFDSFEPFSYEWKEIAEYIDIKPAIEYLKALPAKYTDQEFELFFEVFKDNIIRSVEDAQGQSYQDEWLTKFRKMTQERINEDLNDNLDGMEYKLLDHIDDPDYFKTRAESDHLRLVISKANIKKWLKENQPGDEKDADYIDLFQDNALDFSREPLNTEYVDYYGTLGDWDNWLDYFKDNNEIAGQIDEYRKDEASKKNNIERASLELKPHLTAIDEYINEYITNEPAKGKIKRQIKALKSVIKNAA